MNTKKTSTWITALMHTLRSLVGAFICTAIVSVVLVLALRFYLTYFDTNVSDNRLAIYQGVTFIILASIFLFSVFIVTKMSAISISNIYNVDWRTAHISSFFYLVIILVLGGSPSDYNNVDVPLQMSLIGDLYFILSLLVFYKISKKYITVSNN